MTQPLPAADSEPLDARVARLIAHAQPLRAHLEPDAAMRLLRYLDAMLVENVHVNLTAIRAPEPALVLHAVDSLAMALAFDLASDRARDHAPTAALDLGSGNGFPGIVVHVLWPQCRVVLCDRTQKKVAAIERALTNAGCAGVEAVALDAGQAHALRPEWARAFDLVTVRAVGDPDHVAALARPLLRPKGHLLLWLDAATKAPGIGGFAKPRTYDYALPDPAPRLRRLVVYRRMTS